MNSAQVHKAGRETAAARTATDQTEPWNKLTAIKVAATFRAFTVSCR